MRRVVSIGLLISLLTIFFSEDVTAQKRRKKKKNNKTEIPSADQTRVISDKDKRDSELLFIEAEKYFIIEDFNRSLALFKESLNKNPKNAATHFKIAEILVAQDELNEALGNSLKALQLVDDNKYYYLLAANIYSRLSNLDQAISTYEKMLSKVPGSDEYIFEIAAIHEYNKDWAKAIETYDRAEKKFGISEQISLSKQKLYLRSNDLEGALSETKKLVDNFPGEPRYLIGVAEILISNDKGSEAIPYLEKVLKEFPDYTQAYLVLAELQKKEGDEDAYFANLKKAFASSQVPLPNKLQILIKDFFQKLQSDEEAQKIAQELLALLESAHPNEANVYAVFGDYYFTLQENQEAVTKYKKAIDLDNSNFGVWQNIAELETRLGNFDNVVNYTDEALELFPNQAVLYYFNGIAHYTLKNYEEARFALNEGQKLSSQNEQLQSLFWASLGDTYNSLKDNDKSDEAYDEALKIDSNNDHVLNNYSYFLSLRGENLDKALRMSAKLVKSFPDNPTYLDTHAWVLYQLGKYEESLKYLKQALDNGTDSGTVIEHYGDVLFKLGEIDEAVEQWKKAKGMDTSSDLIDKKIADRKLYE